MDDFYITLGNAKAAELSKRNRTYWEMLRLADNRKSGVVRGTVLEGLAKDFVREFLPAGFTIKSGLVFDAKSKKTSPQCDAIIYKGAPLLDFTDIAVVEKQQTRAILEIKTRIDQPLLFGPKGNQNGGLAAAFRKQRKFLPEGANYILFGFDLRSSSNDTDVLKRLSEVCNSFAVILRYEPKTELKKGKEPAYYNFDNSISRLIQWLRELE